MTQTRLVRWFAKHRWQIAKCQWHRVLETASDAKDAVHQWRKAHLDCSDHRKLKAGYQGNVAEGFFSKLWKTIKVRCRYFCIFLSIPKLFFYIFFANATVGASTLQGVLGRLSFADWDWRSNMRRFFFIKRWAASCIWTALFRKRECVIWIVKAFCQWEESHTALVRKLLSHVYVIFI